MFHCSYSCSSFDSYGVITIEECPGQLNGFTIGAPKDPCRCMIRNTFYLSCWFPGLVVLGDSNRISPLNRAEGDLIASHSRQVLGVSRGK